MMSDPLRSLQELRSLSDSVPYNAAIKEWKKTGGKVIGYFCSYMPEEIIAAVDMLPMRILGYSDEITAADAYLYANTCFFARNCLETALNKGYEFLDGLVAENTCDAIRRLYDVWRLYLPLDFMHILSIPHKVSEDALNFFREELHQFKGRLEEFTGEEITEEGLKQAISLYNESRRLLRDLYALRKDDPPGFSGAEAMEIVRASVTMPRVKFNELLNGLLKEIRYRPSLKANQIRLMISGGIIDRPEFIKAIEDLGGWVVTDDLCMGTRIFWNMVDTSLDPMTGLAHRYLSHPPCARMRPYTLRLNHIKDMVKEFNVHGIIYETIKFCDIFGTEKPMIKADLIASNIPVLELDIQYGGDAAAGQIRTRVEAFIEMLEKERR